MRIYCPGCNRHLISPNMQRVHTEHGAELQCGACRKQLDDSRRWKRRKAQLAFAVAAFKMLQQIFDTELFDPSTQMVTFGAPAALQEVIASYPKP